MSVVNPDASDATITTSSTSSNKLPLDWTRLGNSSTFCCSDPSTCRNPKNHPSISLPRLPLSTTKMTMMHGHAVFCLHELDPSWFQGYFIPNHSTRPWGLLAIQEEVEDCLGCADGGFRRVTLHLYPPSEGHLKDKKEQQQSLARRQFEMVDWTGGDMIQLRHEQLVMDANRLWTGMATLPHLQRYFAGLMAKFRIEMEVEESTPILEFLPNVAVIVGTMSMVDPTMDEDDDEDDNLDADEMDL